MKHYLSILKQMPLFESADDDAILRILNCLDGHQKTFEKNEIIYHYFDQINCAGIVLDGEIDAVILTACGKEYGVRRFTKGTLFGESYACVPSEQSAIQIVAKKKTSVLFLKFSNLFLPQSHCCPFAAQVTANLLRETAKNNIFQNNKLQLLTQKHIRDRLMIYLGSINSSDRTIILPFNRQGLANYLGVERSALSRELCKMKAEGLIDFYKNKITILSESLLRTQYN